MAATESNLPIRAVTALTGVNAITLRAWERRYGLVRPVRTPKGHRLYSYQQVERIRRVLALTGRGVPIGRVRAMIGGEAKGGSARVRSVWQRSIEQMSAAIARFDEQDLDRVYDEAVSVSPVATVTTHLLLPLLVSLGKRWQDLASGIAEEHFFAAYLRSRLGARLLHGIRYAAGPRIVAACAPGDLHEFGLMLFALQAQSAGFRIVLLGANTPLDEILIARRQGDARAVVVSATCEPADDFLSDGLPRLVREAGSPVFVGGAAAILRRREIARAGAIPLDVNIDDGVRLVATRLGDVAAAAQKSRGFSGIR